MIIERLRALIDRSKRVRFVSLGFFFGLILIFLLTFSLTPEKISKIGFLSEKKAAPEVLSNSQEDQNASELVSGILEEKDKDDKKSKVATSSAGPALDSNEKKPKKKEGGAKDKDKEEKSVEEVTLEGILTVEHADDFEKGTGQTWYFLNVGIEKYELEFAKNRPGVAGGAKIKVKGKKTDKKIIIDDAQSSNFEVIEQPHNSHANGSRKLVVVPVNFQDNTATPITQRDINSLVFGQINNFFRENTYEKLAFFGQTFPWKTLSTNTTDDFDSIWKGAANAIYQEYNFGGSQQTQHILVVTVVKSGGHLGEATIGTDVLTLPNIGDVNLTASVVYWDQANDPAMTQFKHTIAHELGHNLKLRHAGVATCGDSGGSSVKTVKDNCTTNETGDSFDSMGYGSSAVHFSAAHKNKTGEWFSADNIRTVTTPSASGTQYTLTPIETNDSNIKMIKVTGALGHSSWYYTLEYRQPIGFDSRTNFGNLWDGVTIHLVKNINDEPTDTYLLDINPNFGGDNDAAIVYGQALFDVDANISITPVSPPTENEIVVRVKSGYPVVPSADCSIYLPNNSVGAINVVGIAGNSTYRVDLFQGLTYVGFQEGTDVTDGVVNGMVTLDFGPLAPGQYTFFGYNESSGHDSCENNPITMTVASPAPPPGTNSPPTALRYDPVPTCSNSPYGTIFGWDTQGYTYSDFEIYQGSTMVFNDRITYSSGGFVTWYESIGNLYPGIVYSWRVQAGNGSGVSGWVNGPSVYVGVCGPPSEPGSFTFTAGPPACSNSFYEGVSARFNISGATQIELKMFQNNNLVWSNEGSAWAAEPYWTWFEIQSSGLIPISTYYVQARSGNSAGWSNWVSSPTWNVPFCNGPADPVVSVPQNVPSCADTVYSGVRTTFFVAGATQVELEAFVNGSPRYGNPITWNLSGGSYTLFTDWVNLLPYSTYTWRVRAGNPVGWSDWAYGQGWYVAYCPTPPDLRPDAITIPDLGLSDNVGTIFVAWNGSPVAMQLNSSVVNSGNTTSGPFNIQWKVNGVPIHTASHPSVGNIVESFGHDSAQYTANAQGIYSVEFCVDSANAVAEGNEGDNCRIVTVEVSDKPNLYIECVGSCLFDLKGVAKGQFKIGEIIVAKFYVRAALPVLAPTNFWVNVWEPATIPFQGNYCNYQGSLASVQVPSINQVVSVAFPAAATPPLGHTAVLIADSHCEVSETDEVNNWMLLYFNSIVGDPGNVDSDGDGFTNDVEIHVGTDPYISCLASYPVSGPSLTWPGDLGTSSFSFNKINVSDLAAFVAPTRRIGTSPGNPNYSVRWDLVPGSTFGETINVQDLSKLTTFLAPMFNNQKAYGGPTCIPQ